MKPAPRAGRGAVTAGGRRSGAARSRGPGCRMGGHPAVMERRWRAGAAWWARPRVYPYFSETPCPSPGRRVFPRYKRPWLQPDFPTPPIEPMLAKIADELPAGDGFLFEPKWDGFRALVFRDGDGVRIQSRDLKPLNRYFPELEKVLAEQLPKGCILDGEIVVAGPQRAGLRRPAAAHPPGRLAHRAARQGNAGRLRRLRPARRRRQVDHGAAAAGAARAAGAPAGIGQAAAAPDAR